MRDDSKRSKEHRELDNPTAPFGALQSLWFFFGQNMDDKGLDVLLKAVLSLAKTPTKSMVRQPNHTPPCARPPVAAIGRFGS
jgi:hypothetical protein